MSLYKAARTHGAIKRLANPNTSALSKASAVIALLSIAATATKKRKKKPGEKWGIGGF